MKQGITAKFHVALGEAFLVISLLLAAFYLGLVPDRNAAIREGRVALAETVALNSSFQIQQGDTVGLEAILRMVVERNPDILSAAIRQTNGDSLVTIGNHVIHWKDLPGGYSIDSQLVVPIWSGDRQWGAVELRFEDLTGEGLSGFLQDSRVQLTLFLAISSFIVFYFYLARMLRHLDPSQAVPARVRTALDTLAEGLLVIDNRGYIVLANQAFAELMATPSDRLVGIIAADLPWSDGKNGKVEAAELPWAQSVREGTPLKNGMIYLQDGSGRRRTLLVNCSPVMGGGSEHGGVLITFEDVTQLEEKEVELRKSKEEAEAANQAKTKFLANMSHEIRTPMNAILGFTEVLKRGYVNSEQDKRKYLNTIYSSGSHLLELINDILDLSKVEAGRMDIEKIRCQPHRIMGDVVQVLGVRAREKSIHLVCEASTPVPETIFSDPARLRQIVTNLVGNAIKFTEQGEVRIQLALNTTGPKPHYAIRVIDSGVGIAEDKLEDIFDPFVQADSSVTRRFGGTGLGLAISKRFARALGGDIHVSSRPGQGSRFTVLLDTGPLQGIPMLQPAQLFSEVEEAGDENQTRWRFPRSRILVVDDGAENRELVKLVLDGTAVEVEDAENGKVCVEMVQEKPYDLILMDVQMPVMDGFTAAKTLRQQGIGTPIIAMTGNAMKGFEQECLAAGYTGYMTKPIKIDALLEKLAEVLGGQRVEGKPDSRAPEAVADESAGQAPDEGALVSRLAGDARFRSVINKFVDKFGQQFELMQDACRQDDLEELARLAHWLKGAGGTVGFDEFTKPAEALERFARSGNRERIDSIMEDMQRLATRLAPAGANNNIKRAEPEPIH